LPLRPVFWKVTAPGMLIAHIAAQPM